MQIREQLEQLIDAAVAAAREDGALSLDETPQAALERPRDEGNGDWASTVALRSAKLAKKNPREIAQIIVDTCLRTTLSSRLRSRAPASSTSA